MSAPILALGDQLARVQAAANILGRLTVLRDASRKVRNPLRLNSSSRLQSFASSPQSDDQHIHIYTAFDVPQTDAVDYIRSLTPVTRSLFDGLSKQYQADAFTVTGIADTRLLAKVQASLGDVVQSGGTDADFRRAVAQLTSAEGVEQLTAAELDNVFQTMSHKAYSAGRYEQLTDPSVREGLPYWQYWTVGDDRVRPEHRVLDHFVALVDDPVWMKIYPPCGWGCRCSVVGITLEEARLYAGYDDPGLARLPLLAAENVPQPGFTTIFGH